MVYKGFIVQLCYCFSPPLGFGRGVFSLKGQGAIGVGHKKTRQKPGFNYLHVKLLLRDHTYGW